MSEAYGTRACDVRREAFDIARCAYGERVQSGIEVDGGGCACARVSCNLFRGVVGVGLRCASTEDI